MGRPGRGRESSLFTARKTTEMTPEQPAANDRVRGLRFHVLPLRSRAAKKTVMQLSRSFKTESSHASTGCYHQHPVDAQRADLQSEEPRNRASHGIRSGEDRSCCSDPHARRSWTEYSHSG